MPRCSAAFAREQLSIDKAVHRTEALYAVLLAQAGLAPYSGGIRPPPGQCYKEGYDAKLFP